MINSRFAPMAKTSSTAVATTIKAIRKALDEKATEKPRAVAGAGKAGFRSLGVRLADVKQIARSLAASGGVPADLAGSVALVDAAFARRVREEILVAVELLASHQADFTPALFAHVDRWVASLDDLDVAGALGPLVVSPLLVQDPGRLATVRKWARTRSAGRRCLAVLSVSALISDGRREVAPTLEICELLLNEDNPVLVAEVAALLRNATRIDAKAVQDFLFRRSVDGNPDILRAGSENLDAARRAALIAKLEAQAALATPPPVEAAR